MSLQIVKLDSCVNILSGFAFKSKYFNSNQEGMPLIRIRNVVESKIETYYSGEYDDQYLIKKGDLLVGMDGDFNRQKWNNEPALLNQRVCKITPIATMMDSSYLYHLLPKELDLIHAVTPCVTVKHLSVQKIKDIELILPSLPEQQRIANILDKAEVITQKREQALALCDEFLRAIFLDMFGDPVSNSKGWDVERLESFILHMNNGLSRRRKVQENIGDIVLRLQDIQYDGIGFEKELNRVELDEDEKKRYELLVGDILFVRVNGNPDYVGRSAVFNGYQEAIFHNDHLIRIRLNEKLLPEYLVFLLHSDVENNLISQQIKTSAGQHTISQKGINNIEIPIPSVELQQEFITVVEKVNAIKARIQQAQELPLFDALSQQAFKGELTQ